MPGNPPPVPLHTIRHPDLRGVLAVCDGPMHLKLTRDEGGRPADALHIHGYVPREDSRMLEKAIWAGLGEDSELPDCLGIVEDGQRSESLAITQSLLLYHLLEAAR